MSEITPAEMSRGIRWVQERLVGFCLLIAIVAIFTSAVSVTWSVSRTSQMQREIDRLESDVGVLSNRSLRLDAYLKAHGIPIEEIYE